MVYGEREHEPFLGREITRQTNISEETARKIDIEVRDLIENNYARAKKILLDHMDQLHFIAKALIKYETLEGKEIDIIMEGKDLQREEQEKANIRPAEEPRDAPFDVAGNDTGDASSGQEAEQSH